MSNQIPKAYEPLVQLLEDAADGAHTNGAAIGLKQNPEAVIRADLAALTGTPAGPGGVPPAVPGLKNLWNTAKGDKVAATAAYRSAQSNGRALAMTCIGTLKPVLGQQWNSAWNAAGFIPVRILFFHEQRQRGGETVQVIFLADRAWTPKSCG